MIRAIKKYISISTVFGLLFLFVSSFNISYALDCNLTGTAPTPMQMFCPFVRLFNLLLIAGGAVFIIIIIVGAIKMVTALGDPKGLMSSTNTWTYAVIGVCIVLGVFAIFAILNKTFGLGLGNYIGPGGTNRIFERISEVVYHLLHDVLKIYNPS